MSVTSASTCGSIDFDHEPPVVLVLGHSYISRLNHFISRDPARDNLALEKSSVLSFMFDVGHDNQPGNVFSASSQLDLVWELSPDAVVLDLGSNDLCSSGSTPETTMTAIVDLALRITRIPSVRHVLVCEIIPRLFVPKWKPNYNAHVHETNSLLAKSLQSFAQRSLLAPSLVLADSQEPVLARRFSPQRCWFVEVLPYHSRRSHEGI